MSKQRKYLIVSWIAVLVWAGIIFYLSSQPAGASNHLSIGLLRLIVKSLGKAISLEIETLAIVNHLLRKSAHFFVYLVFGGLVVNGLRAGGITGKKGLATALGICVLYAVFDEIHQLFVPGRGGQLSDVVLDSIGAIAGIGIFGFLFRRRNNPGDKNTGSKNNADH